MPTGFKSPTVAASRSQSKIPTRFAYKLNSPLQRRSATPESPGLRSLVLVEKYHGSQPSSLQSTPNAKPPLTPKAKPRPAPSRDKPLAKEPTKKPIFKVTAIRDTERVSSPRPVPKKPKTLGKENAERRRDAQTHVPHTTTPTSVPRPFKISIPRSFSSNTRIPVRKHPKRESVTRIRSRPSSLRLTPSRTPRRTSMSIYSALSSPSPRTPVSSSTYIDSVVIQTHDDSDLLSSSVSMNQFSTKSESEWIDEEEVVDKKPVEEASPMKAPSTPEAKPPLTPDATTPTAPEAKPLITPESKAKVSPTAKQQSPAAKSGTLPRVFVVGRLSTSSPGSRRRRAIPPLLDSQAGSANAQIRMELESLRARKKVQEGVTELSDKKL
ncbi:uncharacterized protein EV420DRAFT_609862 [Desarmillaria tabescens]|uniref:Uncharacterized protein n=1 Tax=Armillaria tabescens TaxID=1929756 RepID=A0AA39MFB4_ARMTA|nr:uncharacterized protein EV420DRAFT_609862 [Desarmillaria tabescens]KAK0432751.1 hypothetical protein EV420DRAFT_609862 [Desarmillaria tabescens]